MKVIAFGIHPDDVELGCGGTVALCTTGGHDVVIADLTAGESSSNGTPEERAREAEEARRILGVSERVQLGIPDTGIQAENPEYESLVVATIRRHRPELVLVPNPNDPHPDHESGGRLVKRALYLAGIHGYARLDGPAWRVPSALVYSGRREVRVDVVVDTTATFATKMKAVVAHATQFGDRAGAAPTPLNAPDFLAALEARDVSAGHRVGARYGEAFELIEPIGISSLEIFAGRP